MKKSTKLIVIALLILSFVFLLVCQNNQINFSLGKQESFEHVVKAPEFTLTSQSFQAEQSFSKKQLSTDNGGNQSPQLTWSDFPKESKSFVLTMYDADAPTGSGFWHWIIYDIPANISQLEQDAGNSSAAKLPQGSKMLANDMGQRAYLGPNPPKGDGQHRYVFTVTALDVEKLNISPNASPALLGFTISEHTLARARLIGTFENN